MAIAGVSTKTIAIKLSILPSDAINGIQSARAALEKLTQQQQALEAQGLKNSQVYIRNEAEIKNLNSVISQNQKALQDSINSMKADGDSLNALRAQLAALLKQYDDLTKAEREAAKGTEMLKHIQELTEEIKEIEENTKRFQRSVGGYGDAIQAAIDGTLPMKTAMRQIKQELTELTVKYRESEGAIQGQQAVVERMAQVYGKESQAYKNAVAEMDNLIQKREEMKSQIDDMTKKAGQLDDAITDVNNAIKNAGTDNAPLVAAKQSADLLVNSYTALHGTLVALGIEDKNLIEIYAKLQIVQKGLNAMTKIYNLLQKESVLRQQLNVLWTNLTTKSLGSLINAKRADAAASVGATAGTAALTSGEIAATGATFSLTAALHALKTAILSIPVIGWVLVAVAAVGTLIGVIARANKEEDMGAKIKERILATDRERVRALEEIHRKQSQITEDMLEQLDAVDKMDKGSREYNETIDKIAKYLEVTPEYVKKHKDELEEVIKAQGKSLEIQEQIERNSKEAEENEKKKTELVGETNAALHASWENSNKILEGLEISEDQMKKIQKIRKQLIKGQITSVEAENAVRNVISQEVKGYDELISRSNTLNINLKRQLEETQKIVKTTQTQSDKETNTRSSSYRTSTAKEKRKIEIEERRKAEDLELKMVKEGLEKQLREYRLTVSRQIEDLKERLKTEKNLTVKAKEEINRQITLLSAKQIADEMEIRRKYNDDYLKQQLNLYKSYYKSVENSSSKTSDEYLQARLGSMKLEFDQSVNNLKKSVELINKEYTTLDEVFSKSGEERVEALKKLGMSEEEFQDRFAKVTLEWEQSTETYNKTVENMEVAYKQSVSNVVDDFNKARNDLNQELVDTTLEITWQKRLNEIEVGNFRDMEVKKAEIAQEQAERRLQIAKDEVTRISNMEESTYMEKFGSVEAWKNEIAKAMLEVTKAEGGLQKAINGVNTALKEQKDSALDNAIAIGEAMEDMAGAFSNLFNALAESDKKYSDFATGMAMAQILISSAVSIAKAVEAAVNAGMGTGMAAPATIPVFIAELVAIVASSIASAVGVLNQAKQAKGSAPKFASGGLITEGGDRTGEKDTVHIMASTGEYIIKKKAVDNVGVDFLDRINNFDGRHVSHKSGYYAVGGEIAAGIATAEEAISYEKIKASFAEALQEMPNPVVSVKEITNKQKRVEVKERIANQ